MGKVLLAGYTRVSTGAQDASALGLSAQRSAIKQAANTETFSVNWFEDAGRSGARMSNRPALQEALTEIRAGHLQGIVASRLDRLGRSASEVLTLAEEAQKAGWRLVCLDVGIDSGTPSGELALGALALAARFEHRRISERQLEKHNELRKQGRSRGRPTVPRKVADRIIEMRSSGLSLRAIAQQLDNEGIETAQGAATWSAASITSAITTRERELAALEGHSHQ